MRNRLIFTALLSLVAWQQQWAAGALPPAPQALNIPGSAEAAPLPISEESLLLEPKAAPSSKIFYLKETHQ